MSRYSKLLTTVSAMITLSICGCTSEKIEHTSKPTIITTGNPDALLKSETENNKDNYDALEESENNHFKSIDIDIFNRKVMERETFIAFFGSLESEISQIAVSYINQVAIDTNTTIYNIDVTKGTTENSLNKLYEILNDYLIKKDDGVTTLQIPTVFVIKNGIVIDSHTALIDNSATQLNDEQKETLFTRYTEMMESLK